MTPEQIDTILEFVKQQIQYVGSGKLSVMEMTMATASERYGYRKPRMSLFNWRLFVEWE